MFDCSRFVFFVRRKIRPLFFLSHANIVFCSGSPIFFFGVCKKTVKGFQHQNWRFVFAKCVWTEVLNVNIYKLDKTITNSTLACLE